MIVFPRASIARVFTSPKATNKILLSPAAVEMGGICAVPLQKDFKRLDREHVVQAYNEVTLGAEQFANLRQTLAATLASI